MPVYTPGMQRLARLAVALLLLAARPALAENVLVFAAASLTDVLKDLGQAFGRTTGNTVAFNFAGSNDLARQIVAGAPADAFFSADLARMNELEQAGLVDPAERRDVLSNVLVVVVPAGATTTIAVPADLAKLGKVALANPDAVPAGVYAKQYLQKRGLWGAIAPKVVPTLDVRAALAAVEAEHAEAGIVYATDAAGSQRVRVALRIPRDEGPAIVYPLAPLRKSPKAAARDVVRFLTSPDAKPVYERYGFIVLPAT
jgi:molybdate transport system substrate-binding protein